MTQEFISEYHSIWHLWQAHGLASEKIGEWRLTPISTGEINGIPGSRGRLVATDGIRCYIEQQGKLFLGHLDFWVKDKNKSAVGEPKARKCTSHAKEPKLNRAVFEGLLA